MKRTLGMIAGGALFAMMCGWAFWHSFWPPSGPIQGYESGPGLRSACSILDPARQRQLVPNATASHRTLHRHSSECTLTGGGRELTIKINDHSNARVAQASFKAEENIRKRFGRNFLPPLENPSVGEQAVLDFSYDNDTASAKVLVRKGVRLVEVRYTTPAKVAVGKGADPKYYAEAKAVAVDVAAELLK